MTAEEINEQSQKILDAAMDYMRAAAAARISVRVKAKTRILGCGVPDRAQPGDLVVGNRGAAARVMLDERTSVLYLEYAGNVSNMYLQRERIHDYYR